MDAETASLEIPVCLKKEPHKIIVKIKLLK